MIVVKRMDYLSEPSVKFVSAHSTSYCWPKWCAWNFSFDAGWLKIKRTFFLSHSMRKYDCLYGKTETFIYFYSSIQSNGRHFAGKWSRKNVEKKSLIKVGKTRKNTTHTHTHIKSTIKFMAQNSCDFSVFGWKARMSTLLYLLLRR